MGPTAKVRSQQAADALSAGLIAVADAFGIKAKVIAGDGKQPIGQGIGPALAAHDVLAFCNVRRRLATISAMYVSTNG